jgi:nicotinamidase/pyrazinamidase
MNKLLLIIDAQYDFLVGGNLPVDGAKENMDKLADYIYQSEFSQVAFTLDWHPVTHSSYVTNGGQWPVHCVHYTHGASIYQPVFDAVAKKMHVKDVKIYLKGENPEIEEYSFIQNDDNKEIFSVSMDREEGIDVIEVCGIMSRVCVLNTIKDLVKCGYKDKLTVKLDFIGADDNNLELIEYCKTNEIKLD